MYGYYPVDEGDAYGVPGLTAYMDSYDRWEHDRDERLAQLRDDCLLIPEGDPDDEHDYIKTEDCDRDKNWTRYCYGKTTGFVYKDDGDDDYWELDTDSEETGDDAKAWIQAGHPARQLCIIR